MWPTTGCTTTEPGNGSTFIADIPNPGLTSYRQAGICLSGTWQIGLSAYDINGNESVPTAAIGVAVTIPLEKVGYSTYLPLVRC